jgi:putative transposase
MELWQLDATELARVMRVGQASSREAIVSCFAHIDVVNPKLNAIVRRMDDEAMGAAEELNVTHSAVSRQIRLLEDWLGEALVRFGNPGIFNTDQGAQFTSDEFTKVLRDHGIAISMDGRGRCHDNIFVERLWWTVKHEWVYLRPAANGIEQKRSLGEFFDWYNLRRPHQALGWRTPDEAYLGQSTAATARAA